MFIGIARFELFIPAARSLKDKRHVLRSITASVQRKLSVAVAEVEYQDLWQRAAVGVSCVGGTMTQCRELLQETEKAIARAAVGGAEIVDRDIKVIGMEDV